jgi:hypothetical protein
MAWRCMPSAVAPGDWQDLGLVSYLAVVGLGWPYITGWLALAAGLLAGAWLARRAVSPRSPQPPARSPQPKTHVLKTPRPRVVVVIRVTQAQHAPPAPGRCLLMF